MNIKYAIKLNAEYLQERVGDDCFTDDLGHAIIFETKEAAEDELIGKERVVPIVVDEEGGMIEQEEPSHA